MSLEYFLRAVGAQKSFKPGQNLSRSVHEEGHCHSGCKVESRLVGEGVNTVTQISAAKGNGSSEKLSKLFPGHQPLNGRDQISLTPKLLLPHVAGCCRSDATCKTEPCLWEGGVKLQCPVPVGRCLASHGRPGVLKGCAGRKRSGG